jgi:DNA-binding Lrp family transcriptional regulator
MASASVSGESFNPHWKPPMTLPASNLDPCDSRLLDLVQQGIPFRPRPFEELGKRLAIGEKECISRLKNLRDERKIIRQISAIFDTKALGYESSLVAASYDPAKLEAAAAVIGEHPGVSHCYQRQHPAFNLWYTLAIPPNSRFGLDKTLQKLHALSGALSTRALPTLRLYKIGVKLNISGEEDAGGSPNTGKPFVEADREIAAQYTLNDADRRMIVILQQNMELIPEPFHAWASQAGCGVEELLEAARRFEARRQMRRFAAVLRHREAGFTANVMGVWRIDPVTDADADRCGALMAEAQEVSHCYRRPSYPDWPYCLFTMVHAPTAEACLAVLDRLKSTTGCPEYQALWSIHEFKKVRVKYFTDDIPQWESRHA